MPYADKQKRNEYINAWRRASRRKRGLIKQGRKPLTEEQRVISLQKEKEYQKKYTKEYYMLKPAKRMLHAAKKRAKDRGLPFDLLEEDLVFPSHCPILGIPLITHAPRHSSKKHVASLDRIDNSKGYTKDNVEIISWQANVMKSDCSPELLVKFAIEILKRYG